MSEGRVGAEYLPVVVAAQAWPSTQGSQESRLGLVCGAERGDLLPRNLLASELRYATHREAGLRVFLDTNYLERSLRAIPTGRRNWLTGRRSCLRPG